MQKTIFSLKYEHILLEDKIGELALLIAYTKIAQTKSNVNHLLGESEFAEHNCPTNLCIVKPRSSIHPHQSAHHTSQLHVHAYGREAGQLQHQQLGLQLGYQAEHHALALHVSQLPDHSDGLEVGQLQQLGGQAEPHHQYACYASQLPGLAHD